MKLVRIEKNLLYSMFNAAQISQNLSFFLELGKSVPKYGFFLCETKPRKIMSVENFHLGKSFIGIPNI